MTMIMDTAWRWHRTHPSGYTSEVAPLGAGSTRFGDLAVKLGFVTRDDVNRVLQEQEKLEGEGRGRKMMGLCMVQMGILSTTQLVEILRHYEKGDV